MKKPQYPAVKMNLGQNESLNLFQIGDKFKQGDVVLEVGKITINGRHEIKKEGKYFQTASASTINLYIKRGLWKIC